MQQFTRFIDKKMKLLLIYLLSFFTFYLSDVFAHQNSYRSIQSFFLSVIENRRLSHARSEREAFI
jgi:hypothetical protein